MASYYVDINGNVTKKKKKEEKTPAYKVSLDGKVTKMRDIGPVKETKTSNRMEDIAPVASTERKGQKNSYLQKGALEDGVTVGNAVKGTRATMVDVKEDAAKGILGGAERVVDFFAGVLGKVRANSAEQLWGRLDESTISMLEEDGLIRSAETEEKRAAEFIAKDLINEEKWTQENIIAPFEEKTGIYVEENSFLGAKSDALVQSGSEMAVRMATNYFAPGSGIALAFASAAGGEMENALRSGASFEDAFMSGIITGTGEAVSEQIAGIKFGGKTLTEGVIKTIAKKAPTKALATLAKWGIDTVGEGFEEKFSYFIQAVGQKMTYLSEKEFNEIWSSEESWENFLAGIIMGGVFGGASVVNSAVNPNAKDYVTERNKNEQKVFDSIYEETIKAAEEQKGRKLTAKEKNDIYADVEKQIEKGNIDIETIERVLGGDSYKAYQEASDSEDALRKEYEELGNTTNPTLSQTTRYGELSEKIKGLETNSTKNELKDRMSKEVFEKVKNTRLVESYNEKTRRSQKYEADLTKYDAKQQEVIKRAIESGILNNTNRTHEFVDLIAKISADKGVLFDFTNNQRLKESGLALNGKTVNGFVKGANVTLNINSAKALNKVVGHEIAHVLEGTELYTELQNLMKEYATTKGEYDTRLKEITELYKDVEDADFEKELTADLIGDYLFTDEKFIQNLLHQNQNIFKRMWNEVKYLCKAVTAGTKEAKQLLEVQKMFEKVWKEGKVKTDEKNNIQYSLVGTDKNGIEVYETSEEVKKLPYKERNKLLLKSVLEEYKGRTAKFYKNGKVYYALYDEAGVRKGVYGDKKSDLAGRKAKINIGADGNYIELAENALYSGKSQEKGKTTKNNFHTDAKTWDYYEKTIKSDGKYYDVLINVKDNGNEQYVYDITIKEATLPHRTNLSSRGKLASNDSISQNSQNATGNLKKSLSNNNQDIAPLLGWNVKGSDIAYEDLPIRSGVGQGKQVAFPIDSKAQTVYNNTKGTDVNLIDGGVKDGSTNETGQSGTGIAGISKGRTEGGDQYGSGVQKRRENSGRNIRVSSVFRIVKDTDRQKLNDKGITDNEFWDSSGNPELFSFALESGKASNPNGVMVDSHTAAELVESGAKTFLAKDKMAGGAVMPDGNITAVFKNQNSPAKRAGIDIVTTALANGGTKLDCYGSGLLKLYSRLGFEPVAKVKFNPGYAPDGWDFEKFGTPDIYVMKHNGKTVSEVIDDYTNDTARIFSNEEIAALPYMEYEEAMAYRDSLMNDDASNGGVGGNDGDTFINEDIAPVATKETAEDIAPVGNWKAKESSMVSDEDIAPIGNTSQKQRKWVGTSTRSEAVDGKVAIEELDQDIIHYQPIPNKKTLSRANENLERMGYDAALQYFNSQLENKSVGLNDIALGERLLQEAVKKGDTETAHNLIQNISILGTELGQKVQALSIIKRLSPEGQLQMLEKTVKRGKAKGDKTFEGVEITQEMIDHILSVYGKDGKYKQEDLDRAVEDVKKKIADQMGVTKLEKVNAWRFLSMLGNPKTHIRNLVSNVAMRGTLSVKNAMARTIESVAPIKNRTKTWEKPTDVVKAFADKTVVEMKSEISGDSKYSNDASIKQKREIFKNKILNKIYEFNSDALEKEDWWFSKPAFKNSFAEYLAANGIRTEQDIKNNPETIAKAKAYALEQSQIATFRQFSWLANKIGEIERKNTATNIAVGSVLPFKKTPVNIAKTGLSYSPLGFAKTLTYDISEMKKGNMEASEVVDHLSQNITGTALSLVGFMLASMGVASGGGEDDKEGKYDYQLGEQSYALNVGGKSYSLSWLSPVAMPMFVGVNAYEQLVEGKEWNGDVVMETLAKTLDPLSEMSFLSSLDSVLSSYDSGVEKFSAIGETMAQNYVTQFAPTVMSQVATVLDDKKRTTKVGADSGFKFVDETINNLKYKIPFLRETLEPSTDIWGNDVKQTEDVLARSFETFIAPYSKKENIATEIDDEIKIVYRATGESGVIPSVPANYTNFKDEKYKMSAKEHTEYKKTYGQLANDLLNDLFDTKTYKSATSDEKAEMIGDVYDYARDEAKKELLDKRGIEYTNATEDGIEYYNENAIKGAIEHDMPVDEYKFYRKNPKKHTFFTNELGITYREYDNADKDTKNVYNWAFDNQGKYAVSKVITDNVVEYRDYVKALDNIKGDNAKKQRIDYINSLPIDEGQAMILYRTIYTSKEAKNQYNRKILDYLNSREDLSHDEIATILEELDFTVYPDGRVRW